jgi:tRNA G37 N-methylase TrmD
MQQNKIKVEIYEGEPFSSACCGPVPRVNSMEDVEKLRQTLIERPQIVEKLSAEFKDEAEIHRDLVSEKRWDYPEYVRKLNQEGTALPYIFINGEAAVIGRFPSYEEFMTLLKQRLESMEHRDK